jgi:TIR domain
MGYLKSYQHDIFISYARGPQPHKAFTKERGDFLQQWTHIFVDHLRAQLVFDLGEKAEEDHLDVWMDPDLEINKPLDAELEARVRNSAIFVCVLSEYYLKSTYCLAELESFVTEYPQALEQGLIFPVHVRPTDHSKWPKALSAGRDGQPMGIAFHRPVGQDESVVPFGWPHPSIKEPDYNTALLTLAKGLGTMLRRLKYIEREGSQAPSIAAVPASIGRRVLLGYGDERHDGVRDDLRRRFQGLQMNVWPPSQDEEPFDETTLREMLEEHLPQSDALILIAGEHCGRWPRDQEAGYVSLQLEAAKEHGIPTYVWLDIDDVAKIKNDRYRAYAVKLEKKALLPDPKVRLRFSNVDGFFDYCTTQLDKRPPEKGAEQLAVVYYNPVVEQQDHCLFRERVLDAVADTQRPILIKPPVDTQGQIRLTELRDRLNRSDVIVLLCFDEAFDWATAYAKQIGQVIDESRGRKARLIVIGPESKEGLKIDLRAFRFETIYGVQLDEWSLKARIRQAIDTALAVRGARP